MCISDRLKHVLDVKKMSATEFAEVTGLSYRSVMNYLNEGRDPSVDALIKIHNGLGVSITWLLTGKSCYYNLDQKNFLQNDIFSEQYQRLDAETKDAICTLLKKITNFK